MGTCTIKVLDHYIGGIRLEGNTVITVNNDAIFDYHISTAVQVNKITVSSLGLHVDNRMSQLGGNITTHHVILTDELLFE